VCILIDKTLKHFYILQENLILRKLGNIVLSLTLKENTISYVFTTYIHVEIPTQKGGVLMEMYRVVPQIKESKYQ